MVILVGRGPLTCMDRSLCKYVTVVTASIKCTGTIVIYGTASIDYSNLHSLI
jgi:hypothetical protein